MTVLFLSNNSSIRSFKALDHRRRVQYSTTLLIPPRKLPVCTQIQNTNLETPTVSNSKWRFYDVGSITRLHGHTFTWSGCSGLCRWHTIRALPTPFHSVLVSVSVFMALSTVFHSINSPNHSSLSHSVLPVLFLPYWSFELYISLYLPQPWYNPLWLPGLKSTN